MAHGNTPLNLVAVRACEDCGFNLWHATNVLRPASEIRTCQIGIQKHKDIAHYRRVSICLSQQSPPTSTVQWYACPRLSVTPPSVNRSTSPGMTLDLHPSASTQHKQPTSKLKPRAQSPPPDKAGAMSRAAPAAALAAALALAVTSRVHASATAALEALGTPPLKCLRRFRLFGVPCDLSPASRAAVSFAACLAQDDTHTRPAARITRLCMSPSSSTPDIVVTTED